MRRIFAALLLALTFSVVPVTAASADAGLTVTARWALLGDDPATVVLIGRYSCGPYPGGVPDRGVIDLGVDQVVRGVTVRGIGYLTPTVCDGLPQWYAVELTAYGATFQRGAATWSASGYVEGGGGMQHVFVPPARIRIQ